MGKRVFVYFDKNIEEQVKNIVPAKRFSKAFSHFVKFEYKFPENNIEVFDSEESFEPKKTSVTLQEETIQLLDRYVEKLKEMGMDENRTSRSLVIRHIMKEFLKVLKSGLEDDGYQKLTLRQFWLEKGTMDIIVNLLPANNNSYIVDDFVRREYKPSLNNMERKAGEIEPVTFSISETANQRILDIVKEYGTNKSKVMRDVIDQLTVKLTKKPFVAYLHDYRLTKAIKEHEEYFGAEETRNKLLEYCNHEDQGLS